LVTAEDAGFLLVSLYFRLHVAASSMGERQFGRWKKPMARMM
jgi:hypothetical protein